MASKLGSLLARINYKWKLTINNVFLSPLLLSLPAEGCEVPSTRPQSRIKMMMIMMVRRARKTEALVQFPYVFFFIVLILRQKNPFLVCFYSSPFTHIIFRKQFHDPPAPLSRCCCDCKLISCEDCLFNSLSNCADIIPYITTPEREKSKQIMKYTSITRPCTDCSIFTSRVPDFFYTI